jgi:hypothetical protein
VKRLQEMTGNKSWRICKLLLEPGNPFPAWRNLFLGIDSWAPLTFTNLGSGFLVSCCTLGYISLRYNISPVSARLQPVNDIPEYIFPNIKKYS